MTNIIDDATADRYLNEIDNATGDQRLQMADALEKYADNLADKRFQAAEERFSKLFTDEEFYQSELETEALSNAIQEAPDPDGMAKRSLINAFLEHRAQQPVETINYEAVRDAYAMANYGKKNLDDNQVFDFIRGEYEWQKQRTEAINDLQMQAVAKAINDSQLGQNRPFVDGMTEVFNKWQEKYPELVDGKNDAAFLSQGYKLYYDTINDLDTVRPQASKALSTLTAFTQGNATNEQLQSLANDFVSAPPEDRQKIYKYVTLAAQAGQIDRAGLEQFAINMGQSFTRGFDFVPQGTLQMQEAGVNEVLQAVQKGQQIWVPKNGDLTKATVADKTPKAQVLGQAPTAGMFATTQDGYREATPEEANQFATYAKNAMESFKVVRELRNVAKTGVDPIRPVLEENSFWGTAERGAYGLAGSIPLMGATAVNPYLGVLAYQATEYDRIMLENPDIDPQFAQGLALVEGAANAAIDRVQLKSLSGKLPMFGRYLDRIKSDGIRRTIKIGANVVEQNLQEGAQDLIAPVLETAVAALREDMPDKDFTSLMDEWAGQRAETFFATLPLSLIGGGIATYQDIKNPSAELNATRLRQVGFDKEQITFIQRADNPEEYTARIQMELGNRKQENIEAGRQEVIAEMQKAATPSENDARISESIAEDGTRRWVVTAPDGRELLQTQDQQAALEAVRQHSEAQLLNKQFETAYEPEELRQMVSDLSTQWTSEKPVNTLVMESKGMNAQQELEQLQAAGNAAQIQELHNRIANSPLKDTPYEQINITGKASVDNILGEASVQDVAEMVWRPLITINPNTRPENLREEIHHIGVKIALKNGRVTLDTLRGWLDATEKALPGTFQNLVRETEGDIIESLSQVQAAYENGKINADEETKLPASFIGYIKNMMRVFAEVLRRAVALRGAFKDGILPAEYEAFLAESVGLNQQTLLDTTRERSGAELTQGTFNYSIGSMPENQRAAETSGQPSRGGSLAEVLSKLENAQSKLLAANKYKAKVEKDTLTSQKIEENPIPEGAIVIGWDGSLLGPNGKEIRSAQENWPDPLQFFEDSKNSFTNKSGKKISLDNLFDAWNFLQNTPSEFDKVGSPNIAFLEDATGISLSSFKSTENDKDGSLFSSGKRVSIKDSEQAFLDAVSGFAGQKQKENADFIKWVTGENPLVPGGVMFLFKDGSLYLHNWTPTEEQTQVRGGKYDRKQYKLGFVKDYTIDTPIFEILKETYNRFQNAKNSSTNEIDISGLKDEITSLSNQISSFEKQSIANASLKDGFTLEKGTVYFNAKFPTGYSSNPTTDRKDATTGWILRNPNGGIVEVVNADSIEQAKLVIGSDSFGRKNYFNLPNSTAPATGATNYSIGKKQDTDYLAAVERGDMETAQRMVDEAAKKAGYDVGPVWHGSPDFIGNEFDLNMRGRRGLSRGGFSFTKDKATAEAYMQSGFDPSQRLVDEVNSLMKELQSRVDNGFDWSGPYNETDVPMFRSDAVDDIAELQYYISEIANTLPSDLKSIANELSNRPSPEDYSSNPRLIRAFLKNPKTINVAGNELLLADSPSQIKSADHVTYDDAGNVIPLSQRFNPRSPNINYSIASQSEIDRVNRALGGMNRGPNERLAIYERAKKKFAQVLQSNKESLDAIKSATPINTAPAIEQVESERASKLADLASEETTEVEKALQDNADTFMPRIEAAATLAERKRIERDAKDRAKILEKGIRDKYDERKTAIETEANTQRQQIEQSAASRDSASRARMSEKVRRTKLLQAIGELDAILSVLPPEVRGRVGGFAVLANIGTGDKALGDFFRDRIKKIDTELEKVMVREYTEAITKAVKQSRPKAGDNGVRKSTLGAETQKFADTVYRATLLDDEATAKRMAEIEAALNAPDATAEDISALSEEWSILNTFGDLDNRSSETLAQGLDWLKGQLQMGREEWRIKEQARIDEQRARARQTIEWLGKGTAKKRNATKTKSELASDLANHYLLSHANFEQFVTAVFPPEIAARWAEKLRKADEASQTAEIRDRKGILDAVRAGAKAANMSTAEALLWLKGDQKNAVAYLEDRKVTDERIAIDLAKKIVTGEADRSKLTDADVETLRNELAALPADTQKEFVTIKRVIFRGNDVKLDMSRGKAIQYLLSWNQPDVQIKMRKEGWTDESAADLHTLVNDPVSREVMAYAKELYGKGFGITNPVYARMFGMNMPQVKNYAPTRFLNAKDTKDIGLDGSQTATGTTPGFAKSRVTHSAKIAPEDALTVMQGHIAQQAHWVHFAELAREFRAMLSNPEVRESIKQAHGESVLKDAELWADQMEQRGGNKARESVFLNTILGAALSGKAVSLLGFNLKTLAMQLENSIRFGLSLDMKQIMSALSDPSTITEDIQTVWESDAIQNRLQGGATAEARFLFSRYAGKPNFAAKIAEASMTPINWLDSAATSISSAIVYRANLNDALKNGMPENLAKQTALEAASKAIYRFAQPVSFGQKSIVENNGNVLSKMFFLFMSDARLKTAIIADAARGLATGRGNASEHRRRILTVELMAVISHVISSAFRDAFSDDDDEEIWNLGGFAKAILLAPLQGFFFAGTVGELAISKLTGQKTFNSTTQNPLLSSMEQAIRAGNNLEDAINFDDPDAMLKEWNNIFRSMALSPAMAAPAVLLNMVKPALGLYQNTTTEE